MSNEDKMVVGLVKKKAFSLLPHVRTTMLNPCIENSLVEFNENTSVVFRIAGLSKPVEIPSLSTPGELCDKALRTVVYVLKHHSELHQVPFTIIDGTNWAEAVGTRTFGLDIQFINVFWHELKPVIAVMLAERKIVKDDKHYHLNNTVRFPIIFPYHPDAPESVNLINMSVAVQAPGNGGPFYHFNECIAEALQQTCREDNEYPVAAASYLDDVIWYVDRPGRHHHVIHSKEYLDVKRGLPKETIVEVQGFLTNHGNFVGRYRGMLMAARNRMIIDTPAFEMEVKCCEEKMYREIERHMGGIIREEDRQAGGYRVADVALFSEDLW